MIIYCILMDCWSRVTSKNLGDRHDLFQFVQSFSARSTFWSPWSARLAPRYHSENAKVPPSAITHHWHPERNQFIFLGPERVHCRRRLRSQKARPKVPTGSIWKGVLGLHLSTHFETRQYLLLCNNHQVTISFRFQALPFWHTRSIDFRIEKTHHGSWVSF